MKKNKEIIIGAIFVIVVVAGFILAGWSNTRNSAPPTAALNQPSALTTQESSFDFGTISMAKGKVSHNFKLKNTASEPVAITKLYTSCMCTGAVLKAGNESLGPFGMPGHGFVPAVNKNVASGEEISIEAIFDPAAHGPAGIGRIDRVIYIENSSGRPLELQISAQVIP